MDATKPARASTWESTEQIIFCNDRDSGLRAVIAIDDSRLGPALGGVRWLGYPSEWAAAEEARRLAAGMTRKHAIAGLPYGGGKAVVFSDTEAGDPDARHAALRAFGRFVAGLNGAYIPGVDMGTAPEDMQVIAELAPDVACSEIDPSPSTATGVLAAMRAAISHCYGDPSPAGLRILVQGAGSVGSPIARALAQEGAEILVADLDAARAAALAQECGGRVVAPERAMRTHCDVLAPCAAARVLSTEVARTTTARIVAGGANDTLADDSVADVLAARGVLYIPDYVANAGGIIDIDARRRGVSAEGLDAALTAIGDRVSELISLAEATGATTVATAESMAQSRLTAAHAGVS